MSEQTVTDFAVAAYQEEDGSWTVLPLPLQVAEDLSELTAAVRHLPAEMGAVALVSVADDFFLVLRVRGAQERLLVSDAALADEWPLGRQALDALDAEVPDEDADVTPAGDLGILADLGVDPLELSAICADLDAYPDEQLGRIAERLGFGEDFDRALDGSL